MLKRHEIQVLRKAGHNATEVAALAPLGGELAPSIRLNGLNGERHFFDQALEKLQSRTGVTPWIDAEHAKTRAKKPGWTFIVSIWTRSPGTGRL